MSSLLPTDHASPSLILVVEDDLGIQATISWILESEGYEVIMASNGVEALELLQHYLPGLVLLDLMLPRLSGLEVLEVLGQADPPWTGPILALSASPSLLQEAKQVPLVSATISKPFDVEHLLAVIAQYVA